MKAEASDVVKLTLKVEFNMLEPAAFTADTAIKYIVFGCKPVIFTSPRDAAPSGEIDDKIRHGNLVELVQEETHDDCSRGFAPVKTAVGYGGENVGRDETITRIGATNFKEASELLTKTLYAIKSIPPSSNGGAQATCTKVLPRGYCIASRYEENADSEVNARTES